MQDEAALLERIQEYNTEALAEVYDQFYDRIYRYIYGYLGQVDTAEDLAASVFFRLLNAVQNGKSPRKNLSAWLYRVAHNLVVDMFRRRPSEELELAEWLESEQPGPAQTVEQLIQLERVRAALRQLTEAQQQVIMLRFFVGMDGHEIAIIMGKSDGAIDALQHRALLALRKVLSEGAGPGVQGSVAGGEDGSASRGLGRERGSCAAMIGAGVFRRLLALLAPAVRGASAPAGPGGSGG